MEKFNLLMPFQKSIIPYVVAGFSNPEIALIFNYSISTVKSEMSEIFKITESLGRVHLAVKADRTGLFKRLKDEEIKEIRKRIQEN